MSKDHLRRFIDQYCIFRADPERMYKGCDVKGKLSAEPGPPWKWEFKLRNLTQSPLQLNIVAAELHDMAYDLDTRPKQLIGLETGSIPIMTALSLTREFVYFNTMTVRKERKSYGVRSLVEGRCFQDSPCLVVDDLIASGSGCRSCIDTAIDCLGLEVLPFVLCIVNKGTSDKLVHRDKTYKILSLFKSAEFNLLKFDPNTYWEPKDFEWEPPTQ